MLVALTLVAIGFLLLIKGADLLVEGSVFMAYRLGLSTLVIGLTVVAFGTSAPELFVSVDAALKGNPDVALGNVVGSNICNILGIIGIATIISKLEVPELVIKQDLPYMLLAVISLYFCSLDTIISRLEGSLLFIGILVYLGLSYKTATKKENSESNSEADDYDQPVGMRSAKAFAFVLFGLLAMLVGAELIVGNATTIAKSFGVSDLVIGMSLVAVGTSLPEIATTVIAAKRGQSSLAIGNAVGSNIFNVLCVLGLTATIHPLKIDANALIEDIPFMVFTCFAVWLVLKYKKKSQQPSGCIVFTGLLCLRLLFVYKIQCLSLIQN